LKRLWELFGLSEGPLGILDWRPRGFHAIARPGAVRRLPC
jgi:hypothetical protein